MPLIDPSIEERAKEAGVPAFHIRLDRALAAYALAQDTPDMDMVSAHKVLIAALNLNGLDLVEVQYV